MLLEVAEVALASTAVLAGTFAALWRHEADLRSKWRAAYLAHECPSTSHAYTAGYQDGLDEADTEAKERVEHHPMCLGLGMPCCPQMAMAVRNPCGHGNECTFEVCDHEDYG